MLKATIAHNLLGSDGPFELRLDLLVQAGEILGLKGPSGCGKTTALKSLGGLIKTNSIIEFSGRIWQNEDIFLPPQSRRTGIVFQDYALFPHLTALKNILFAAKSPDTAMYWLKALNLWELREVYPHKLSGGQKQRVALARALAMHPDLLLLDEPLAALDESTKSKVRALLLEYLKTHSIPSILVSHDKEDLLALCTRQIDIHPV